MGCEMTVEVDSCLMHVSATVLHPYPFSIFSAPRSPFKTLENKYWYCWHAGGSRQLGSNQAITNGKGMVGPLFGFFYVLVVI